MKLNELRNRLINGGLRVTPQRIAIYGAVVTLYNHPAAEQIIDYIRKKQPNVSIATVYKVLDALVDHKLIKRVNTQRDITRYDAILEPHHHIFYSDSDKITDFVDYELSSMLKDYFTKKEIPGFIIEDIRLNIIGKSKKTADNT